MYLRTMRRLALLVGVAISAVTMSAAPSVAGAHGFTHGHQAVTYGNTSLVLDPGAASALQSLGVTPGVIAPATASANGSLQFPITDSFPRTLGTGVINHSGGISLTAGSTTVALTDFNINLAGQTLTAEVGGSRVPILNLSFAKSHIGFRNGAVTIGPVAATLTQTAADALNGAFGVTAFTKGLLLGQATVNYRLFPTFW